VCDRAFVRLDQRLRRPRYGARVVVRTPPTRVAEAIAPLVLAPECEGLSGRFYMAGREIDATPYTRDPEVGARLWDVSASLTALVEAVTR